MADTNSTAFLYSSITKLAYAESQLSIHPRAPFDFSHRQALDNQANALGDCAARFRLKNPLPMDQTAIFAAQGLVKNAQALFDYIQTSIGPTFSCQKVFDAVTAVITAVDKL